MQSLKRRESKADLCRLFLIFVSMFDFLIFDNFHVYIRQKEITGSWKRNHLTFTAYCDVTYMFLNSDADNLNHLFLFSGVFFVVFLFSDKGTSLSFHFSVA